MAYLFFVFISDLIHTTVFNNNDDDNQNNSLDKSL
jgi:hypothetical protein